ncbi:Concanavalin A-like lectin/glucanase, subgroup [Cynara cardunculus var. scolymus]|uniref:Concanavalin A-like lectin/glucanase, subgroup n=1 Tax=Cynara cardunculus var. scolymus TaxID=59895 RepID=A0A118K0L5_CYNCS|nr:Concanavalin A-like lectin/glucanase, subgroup [Cynara cardunculus var. scolymus]
MMGLLAILATPNCFGNTDPRDIFAINSLYAALGFPPLPGWLLSGGDPCSEGWQGVQCVNSNITGIDLSNNHIGGGIPADLPLTLKTFFLSGNQLTGSIPDSLSMLGQLTDLSLNNNHLSGIIPDSFQQLTALVNLDLSANNISGPLPPSMTNLLSISTLDIKNNLFSGPIPPKLLSIPNFRSKGNPFNTTIIPLPPVSSPSPSSTFETQPPDIQPDNQALGPSSPVLSHSSNEHNSIWHNKVVWVAIGGFLVLILLALGLCVRMSRRRKEKSSIKVSGHVKNPMLNKENEASNGRNDLLPRFNSKQEKLVTVSKRPTPPLPPQSLVGERVVVKPVAIPTTTAKNANFPGVFSIASLQQYTNSFSQENLIGRGILGTVYRARLPNGKLLAVKKLENATLKQWSDEDFMGYLHEVCKPLVVHQNFKSTNILLDDELNVRVSDCGLAPLIPSSYVSQFDFYRSRSRGEQFLVRWAVPRLHDIEALSRMVDPSLDAAYSSKSLSRFADIISLCVQAEPEFRPPMSEIVQNLMHMSKINE